VVLPGIRLKRFQVRIVAVILRVPPRVTAAHQFLVQHAAIGQHDVSYHAPVSVCIVLDNLDCAV